MSVQAARLVQALNPFPTSALGWFCLGYNVSDAPGRVDAIMQLLLRSSVVDSAVVTQHAVSTVLQRLLREMPATIAISKSPWAVLTPLARDVGSTSAVASCCSEWAAFTGVSTCRLQRDGGVCGRPLCRWRTTPAVFMTLSRGMLQGHVLFLRCFACSAVYGGRWRWDNVPEKSCFPDGFHHARLAGSAKHSTRWFYSTPQICWEIPLLQFLLGCAARGGMSLTGTFEVYMRVWAPTMLGTMYCKRTHFIDKLEVALLAWACVALIEASLLDVSGFLWHLRPHHVSEDFLPLLEVVRAAFDALSILHRCWLAQVIKLLIVDGKWCVQTSVCNARDVGLVWEPALGTGFLKGCTNRPAPGSKYCAEHVSQCTTAP
jgi:hypothetical protein